MKKRSGLLKILLLMIPMFLTQCQNNGDIGDLYGKWKLHDISVQNTSLPTEYNGSIFWTFQNSTVNIQNVQSMETADCYGNWRMEDGTLFLDFPFDLQSPPAVLRLPRKSAMQVMKISKNELTLTYHPTLDSSITYYLRKW